ncbi:electron transfer flavoprotein subunit alpha [Ignatzschineria indica]|uniref:Electron transfer flavoprotein subunit alpha n=1 Tax=Ignatzschineria indica TaxID=472583 RepID=A0A2U2AJ05_9GAMM|nr:FAD-binding protein [Ignatzschineria indica]PWD82633.1 electron transfer flavoprotein subunit alpha [Ignatzschineria indica]GGZ85461.1 electron transfer flavoprotein subunit alpha [Ignatzschineria indica]
MKTLIIAEYKNSQLTTQTLSSINAAKKITSNITLLILGQNLQPIISDAITIKGITEVIYAEHDCFDHFLAENIASFVASIAHEYTHIFSNATTDGKNYSPRIAALLDTEQISEISEVINDNTFKRPIYAGNIIATVQSSAKIKVITVRSSSFDSTVERSEATSARNLCLDNFRPFTKTSFIKNEHKSSDRPDLTSAHIVVSGGRALQSKENFKLIYSLADKLGAAVGGSRAAVDSGFISNDLQIGQTGKVVAPSIYLAFGISGAIQHLAGMKESKKIFAINNDPDAQIFQVADYGIIGDLFDILPQLIKEL